MISIERIGLIPTADLIRDSEVAHQPDAESILQECMFRSIEIRQGLVDGKLACVWGLIPPTLLSDSAYLWLLTTPLVAEHKFLFVRHSQIHIQELLKTYPKIIGDVGNQQAKRWLEWLGAKFHKQIGGRVSFVIEAK